MNCNCGAKGFKPSRMEGRCEFCDGTAGGNPPTDQEVKEWNDQKFGQPHFGHSDEAAEPQPHGYVDQDR